MYKDETFLFRHNLSQAETFVVSLISHLKELNEFIGDNLLN